MEPPKKRLYQEIGWFKLRAHHLKRHSRCNFCGELGQVVDHIIPHKGSRRLFFDPSNLQTLCKKCHDSTKQKMERSTQAGSNLDGTPINPPPWWNR